VSDFDKTNTFTINKNDKGDNPDRPDFKLDINIDGVRYFGSGWTRQSANGSFVSGPIELADQKYQPNGAVPAGVSNEADDFDF